jgi:pimeloyl-ACP methyl ester carboxylesterase
MTTAQSEQKAPVIVGHFSHTSCWLDEPDGWAFFVSHYDGQVKRLIVFVHGFRGGSVGTWTDFPFIDAALPENLWWYESDYLFVGYNSTKDTINGVADRITRDMARFYPVPFAPAMEICGLPARDDTTTPYEELVLVGHSLGGVILRRALCDAAQKWIADSDRQKDTRPALLDATTRLFSPASAGFRPAGWLGLLRETVLWARAIELFLRRAPAYTDLQPGSLVLTAIQRRTEEFAKRGDPDLNALRAHILWASPDYVVIDERYETDHVSQSCDNTSHISVCKPRDAEFVAPWVFVENGSVD